MTFFLLFKIVIGIAIFVLVYYGNQKRTAKLRRITHAMGFHFSPEGSKALLKQLTGFADFARAKPKQITNLVRGQALNVEVSIFDFAREKGITETMMLFRSPALRLPSFVLLPLSWHHHLGRLFGFQIIGFEGRPKFSRNYCLRGGDEEAIRSVFFTDVLAYFERHPGFCVQGNSDKLLVYRQRKQIKPETLRPFMRKGFTVFSLFKSPQPAGQELPQSRDEPETMAIFFPNGDPISENI